MGFEKKAKYAMKCKWYSYLMGHVLKICIYKLIYLQNVCGPQKFQETASLKIYIHTIGQGGYAKIHGMSAIEMYARKCDVTLKCMDCTKKWVANVDNCIWNYVKYIFEKSEMKWITTQVIFLNLRKDLIP